MNVTNIEKQKNLLFFLNIFFVRQNVNKIKGNITVISFSIKKCNINKNS